MLTKILVVPTVLVLLSIGAVLSIFDPKYHEKNKPYRRDPHIARALERHHQLSRYVNEPVGTRVSEYHPRLSTAHNQQNENIEQHERHSSYGRDFANNIDDYYDGCPSGFTGQRPYPYDCRRFVNCWKGRAYIQTCGPGTVFNSETLECDSPTKVVCHGLNKKNGDAPNNRLGRIQTDDVSCPVGYTGLLPHPHDCSKFLNCASGTMYIQTCAPDTMFNPTLKVCDFVYKVDCSGRGGEVYGLASSAAPQVPGSGYRDGKTFAAGARGNQLPNQEVPYRKGWPHHHHHHEQHHQHHQGHPQDSYGSGSSVHYQFNCTESSHNHHQSPSPAVSSNTPLVYRDRWSSMNRTRPPLVPDRPSWQSTTPNRHWTKTTSWTPIPATTTTTLPPRPRPTWQSHGSSWTTTTARPSSNYPSFTYPSDRTDTTTTTTTTETTKIYYAQPVYDDQPSEEVFSNVYGGDVSEITLPFHRRNASRGAVVPPSHPSTDAINIPNPNLMPPHLPPSTDDDGQAPIPEQLPDFSAPRPSYVFPPPSRPSYSSHTTFSTTPSRGRDPLPPSTDDHSSMDVVHIPSMHLLPPHESPPNDDRQSKQYPTAPRPDPHNRTPSSSGGRPSIDATNITPQWSSSPYPDQGIPIYPVPGISTFNTTTIYITSPRPVPNKPVYDETNLYGGLLPPLPSAPEPSSDDQFTVLLPPSTPTPPLRPSYSKTTTTTPPPGVKTNVHVFQIYPPPSVQNATNKLHPRPFYSPPYSGVAHSRNTTWSSYSPTKTKQYTTPSPPPKGNFEPEIIFSRDGGLVMSPKTSNRQGDLPSSYNNQYYKQTTPPSVYRAPSETDPEDDVGQLPISEAIRLLLRPYFNRSGTVSDEMAAKAESHIMSLAPGKEPTRQTTTISTTPSTTSSTSSSTTTSTSSVSPELDKEVETIVAGEQNSLTGDFDHPIHTHAHTSPSNYHQPLHHNQDFHRNHPHLPNPFQTAPHEPELITQRTWSKDPSTTTTEPSVVAANPAVDDVCQFDCGNGKCIKTFETCDGVNNCGNRKDELNCDHLGYEIRLSNEGSGRIEVKILGQWGYVCDDKFGIQDANVVCRELGYPLGASAVLGNSFYPPVGDDVSFVMDEVDCTGNETSLKDCPFMGWGVSDCGPEEVVGVQCKSTEMKCPNSDYWLCSTSKECIPPAFVCDNIPDCSDQSDESPLVCNSTVEYRLKGGRSKQEGRLEVLYRQVWGTVCDDDFGHIEAQVACNTLGFYGRAKVVKNAFGPGSGPIWLDQISCFGNETTLDQCNHWTWGQHNCNHTEDVSLKCTAGPPPRTTLTKSSSEPADDDVQTPTLDDIGVDLYPVERSSKFKANRKICGRFNANLTEEEPLEFERVVKGNVAKRGHHPWQATIRTKGRGGISSHWCGAVLISKKHLLTAAHCLVGYPKGAYFIRLGDHYANIAESSEIDSYIENWYIHEKFREGTHMNNDIALIVIKTPVRFNDYIQPICLPPEGIQYNDGRLCTISGWGSIQSGVSTPSNKLQAAMVPIISDDTCKVPHVYGKSITEGMFCAGFLEEGVDACEGDSGGPFTCSDSDVETLYGIISWGQQCGHANKPGVYVRIEKYLDWIYEKIRFSLQQTD